MGLTQLGVIPSAPKMSMVCTPRDTPCRKCDLKTTKAGRERVVTTQPETSLSLLLLLSPSAWPLPFQENPAGSEITPLLAMWLQVHSSPCRDLEVSDTSRQGVPPYKHVSTMETSTSGGQCLYSIPSGAPLHAGVGAGSWRWQTGLREEKPSMAGIKPSMGLTDPVACPITASHQRSQCGHPEWPLESERDRSLVLLAELPKPP